MFFGITQSSFKYYYRLAQWWGTNDQISDWSDLQFQRSTSESAWVVLNGSWGIFCLAESKWISGISENGDFHCTYSSWDMIQNVLSYLSCGKEYYLLTKFLWLKFVYDLLRLHSYAAFHLPWKPDFGAGNDVMPNLTAFHLYKLENKISRNYFWKSNFGGISVDISEWEFGNPDFPVQMECSISFQEDLVRFYQFVLGPLIKKIRLNLINMYTVENPLLHNNNNIQFNFFQFSLFV